MEIRGCIFDLDGTLANTLASIAGFVNDTLAAWGFGVIPVQDYRYLVGNGADLLLHRALDRVGASLDEEEYGRFRGEYDRRYAADPLREVTVYPGMPDLIRELGAAGLRLGVLSNKPDDMTRAVVGALYGDSIPLMRGQREGVPPKPDPAAPLAMAAQMGLAPGKILWVGDSGVDMDTARSAGMQACGVLWGFREREELAAHGARFCAKDAQELREIILG